MDNNNPKSFLKKESSIYFMVTILAIIIVFAGIYVYISYFLVEIKGPSMNPQKNLVERQLEQLDKLRGEVKPLTEEEIEDQMNALDVLHEEIGSEGDAQEQLEELDKIHNQ